MKKQPIKRVHELQGVSRDHHQALVLARKIKIGLDKQINPKRIQAYLEWFWNQHFAPHFAIEEKYMFGILGHDNPLIIQALQDHKDIHRLCLKDDISLEELESLQQQIIAHVRLEERQIFQEIQQLATQEQLDTIEQHHQEKDFCENTSDEFWK